MLKQANLSFSVTAQANGNETNAIQFSTQDKKTAKLIFTIKEGKAPLNLTDIDGEITLVMQDKSRFIDKVEVTKPLDGVLEYTLTQEQIRHAGRAQGEIKLTDKDGSSASGFRFTFTIKKALMDEDLGPVKEFYINDLEAVKQEVQEKADAINTDIDSFKENVDQRTSAIEETITQLEEGVTESVVVQVETAKKDTTGQTHTDLDSRIKADVGRVSERLVDTVDDLSQRGINPKMFGAIGGGIENDSIAIQSAIDFLSSKGGGDVIISGKYGIGDTIDLKSGVSLNCINGEIILLNNVNGITFNRNTKIKGRLIVRVPNDYTKSALYFDGAKQLSTRDTRIDDIFLQGHNATGKGNAIHLQCSTPNSSISFVNFGKVVIRGFEKGVFLDAPVVSTGFNYVNGNVFENITISDCDHHIYGTGDHTSRNDVDGNTFVNAQLQYSARTKEILHIEGRNNVLKGFLWDSSNHDVLAVNLTANSRGNTIEMYGSNNPNIYVDEGKDNYVNVLDEWYDKVRLPVKSTQPPYTKRFEGEFQDILHYAHKLHSISVVEGGTLIKSGTIDSVFDDMTYTALTLDLSNDQSFSFEILFNGKAYKGINTSYLYGGIKKLGLGIASSRAPKIITIETTNNNDEVKSSTLNCVGKANRPVFSFEDNSLNGLGVHLKKLKITLTGQQSSDVRIARIFANSYNLSGVKFLSNAGGMVAGDIEFVERNNGIILKSPDGSRFRITVNNDGTLSTSKL